MAQSLEWINKFNKKKIGLIRYQPQPRRNNHQLTTTCLINIVVLMIPISTTNSNHYFKIFYLILIIINQWFCKSKTAGENRESSKTRWHSWCELIINGVYDPQEKSLVVDTLSQHVAVHHIKNQAHLK